jgi:hypothetical protein
MLKSSCLLCLNRLIDVIIFRISIVRMPSGSGQMARSTNYKQPILVEYIGPIPEQLELDVLLKRIWAEAIADDPHRLPRSPGSKGVLRVPPFELRRKQGSHPDLSNLIVMAGTSGIHLAVMALHDLWKQVMLPGFKRRGAMAWRERPPRKAPARRGRLAKSSQTPKSGRQPKSTQRSKRPNPTARSAAGRRTPKLS